MVEPLSVTITVIAFATAVKDLIEVARNIQDAFSKLPANHKKAKSVIQEVREILEHMDAVYGEDLETSYYSSSLKESLNELKCKMDLVKNRCATLIPAEVKARRKKFKIAVVTFWNRKKVEEVILDLKEQVDKSLRLFQLLCHTRTEKTVMRMNHTVNNALPEPMIKFQSDGGIPVFNASLFSFFQSDSMSITRMRNNIPNEDLSNAFLRREFDILVHSVESLSVRWLEKQMGDLEISPFKASFYLQILPASRPIRQREALIVVYQIRDIIDAPNALWVNKVNFFLCFLTNIFESLRMNAESIAVRNLRVKLWSTVSGLYSDRNTNAHVVAAFTSLAIGLSAVGETEKSHLISERALNMIKDSPDMAKADILHSLSAYNMAAESKNNENDPVTALKMIKCAVQHMRTVLVIIGSSETGLAQVEDSTFQETVEDLVKNSATHDHMYGYAHILAILSMVQLRNKLHDEARTSAKRALAILRRLLDVYQGSIWILIIMSKTLAHLTHPSLSELSETKENLQNAQENEEIQTQLARVDPQRYVLSLFSSMTTTRTALVAQGKTRQAQSVHQRMLDLGKMASDNYTSLKIPSETEGDYYFKTAEYHFSCGRFQDAVYAAQNAIAQHSALEDMTSGQSPVKHFLTAVFLCKNLARLQQYDACLDAGFKALRLLDESTRARGDDIAIIDAHMELLDRMMDLLDSTVDTRALEWAREINRRIQRLFSSAQSSGRKIELQNAQAPNKFVSILRKNDLIEEAALYLEGSIKCWDDTYGKSLNVDMIGISYLQCLIALPKGFKDKGETDKALHYSQQAMDVAEGYFNKGLHMVKVAIYNSLASTHINLLCDAGRYSEALQLSELAVTYVHENEHLFHAGNSWLVMALCNRAYCLLYSCRPQKAITVATEGLSLSQKAIEGAEIPNTRSTQLTMLYVSLLNLADGFADSGDAGRSLIHLSEAKDALAKREIADSEDVGSAFHSYQVLAEKEARIIFAKGEYAKVAELMEKVIDEERERAKTRKSLLPSLIMALQFVGILYCTMGRHKDGALVAAEIADLKRSLEDTPSLIRLLEVEEKRMIRRGKWKPVEKAKGQLSCGHQDSTMYPTSYATEEPGSGDLEQATSFRDMVSRICRILIGHSILHHFLFLFLSLFISSLML